MYLKIKNKKIDIKEPDNLKDQFKSFKFYFDKIDFGIKLKKKFINTYLFCQRVDICVTDKNNKIIKLYNNIKTEKFRFFFKAKYIYYLPLDTVKHLKLGDEFKIHK